MATHDYSIANQSFPATRSDINNALTAIKSSNSSATAPSTSLVTGQTFYDTSSNTLKVYNGSAFVTLLSGELVAADIAANAVGSSELAANAVDSDHYVDGSIDIIHFSSALGDLRRGVTAVGIDASDGIAFDNNVKQQFSIGGSEKMRITSTGDLDVDGNVTAYSTTISDERLKTGITTVADALTKVSQLNGVEFTRKNTGQRSAGVIAQQVEKVLPQAIREKKLPLQTGDEETMYKTVEYDALHSLYIEAIKELKDMVEKQAVQIKELQDT